MTKPRNYPDEIESAETGRTLRRGVKMMTIPGWWASLDDPADTDGQLTDEDNVIRVVPSSSMTRLLLLAARRPDLFQKGAGMKMISEADASLIREIVRKSSVNRIYARIDNSQPFEAQVGP